MNPSANQSPCLSIKCLSPVPLDGEVKAEFGSESTDYTMEKLTEILNQRETMEGGTEWKSVHGMTTEERNRLFNMKQEKEAEDGTDENSVDEMTIEEKDRLCNLKNEDDDDEEEEKDEEVEESEERQIVKLEWEDGVGDDLGFGIKQEVMDEEEETGGTDLNFPTYRCERKGVESEYCQKEGLSSLVTECLLKQPRVSINRLNITGISVGVSPECCSVASEEDDLGLRSQWRSGELSPMLGNCPQRQMGEVTTWKREMFGQLNRTGIQLPSSLDNGIFIDATSNHLDSHNSQETAETVEAASPLFHCSHCPFFHTEEVSLQQHFEKVHLEELAGPVVSGEKGRTAAPCVGRNSRSSAFCRNTRNFMLSSIPSKDQSAKNGSRSRCPGSSVTTWPYFPELHETLRQRNSICPLNLIASATDSSEEANEVPQVLNPRKSGAVEKRARAQAAVASPPIPSPRTEAELEAAAGGQPHYTPIFAGSRQGPTLCTHEFAAGREVTVDLHKQTKTIHKNVVGNPNRRKLWVNEVRRLGWKPTSSSLLCQEHFDCDQFENSRADGKKKLKSSAVPTIFSPSQSRTLRKSIKKRSPLRTPGNRVCVRSGLQEHNYNLPPEEDGCSSSAYVVLMEEPKLASTSHHFLRRVVESTKSKDPNSQSEPLLDSIKYLSPVPSGGDVKAEFGFDSTYFTVEEPTERLIINDGMEGGIEWDSVHGMTKEQRHRLFNIKQEEEESEEVVKVKIDEDTLYELTTEEKDRICNLKSEEQEEEEVGGSEGIQIVKIELDVIEDI
ncbi:hypothetical protein GJAV_G00122280 [Gymnothorax javanicus]|nr:hypothetical protein GJAV_G00122280 [Gymnothorax javanicus]